MYPDNIEPYDTDMLKVSDIHTVYYEQSGNKTGKPVIFLYVFIYLYIWFVKTKMLDKFKSLLIKKVH